MPNDQKTYSVRETAEILGIKERAVQTRCKKDDIRKKDNKYLITDSIISIWKEKEELNAKANAIQTQTQSATQTQLDLEVEVLKIENEDLKKEVEEIKEELSQFQIEENERIEVFTNQEYTVFEQRLIEWRTLQKDLEHQQELFKAKEEGSVQVIEHYKKQYDYLKQANDRMLDVHEKLIETVQSQSTLALQRNFIEAKDKGHDKK